MRNSFSGRYQENAFRCPQLPPLPLAEMPQGWRETGNEPQKYRINPLPPKKNNGVGGLKAGISISQYIQTHNSATCLVLGPPSRSV